MSEIVTIEGSVTPSSYLPRGDRRVVVRTEFIDKLERRGFIVVVSSDSRDSEVVPDPADGAAVLVVPSKNATTAAWAEFLEAEGVEFDDDAGRDALIALWDRENG